MRSSHRICTVCLGWLTLAAAAPADLASGERSDSENNQARKLRLQQMPAAKKEELIRKKERFDRLPPREQQRLRQLQTAIAADPQSGRLRQVMVRYHEWLKALPSGQRTELLSMPASARVEQIRRVIKQQERQQFTDLTSRRLLPADREAILRWLSDLVVRREEELLAALPPDMQKRVQSMNQRDRVRSLMFHSRRRRGPDKSIIDLIRLTDDDVDRLAASLSESVRQTLSEVQNKQDRQDLLRGWVAAALFSRSMPRASEEELKTLYDGLPPAQKERLENLPQARRMNELRRLFVKKRFEERGWSWPRRKRRGPSREQP